MKTHALKIVLGVAALAVGIFLGRFVAGDGRDNLTLDGEGLSRNVQKPRPPDVAESGTDKKKRTFKALLKSRKANAGFPESRREMERLSISELKSLILDCGVNEGKYGEETRAGWSIFNAASEELYRREGEDALKWADGLEAEDRKLVLTWVLRQAAFENPELAKPWIERFRTEFGAGAITAFAHPAIQGATGRGAEELIQLKESYGDLLDGAGFPQGTYADDFDFHRFVTSGMTSGMEAMEPFQYWSAKDKEAAWEGFKEVLEKDRSIFASYFGSVFTGVAAVEGEAKAAEWMMSKLDEIPADARKSALSSLQQGGTLTSQGVESVMAALPNAADRATFAGSLISPNRVNPLGTIALEKLPVEERLQAVVNAATSNQGWARGDTPEAKKARANLDAVAERAGLSVEQRAQVSAILVPGEN